MDRPLAVTAILIISFAVRSQRQTEILLEMAEYRSSGSVSKIKDSVSHCIYNLIFWSSHFQLNVENLEGVVIYTCLFTFYHLAMENWASYLTPLGIYFFIYTMSEHCFAQSRKTHSYQMTFHFSQTLCNYNDS